MDDAAGRRLGGAAPPALDADLALMAQIGLDMMDLAEFAGVDHALDLAHRGAIAVVVADAEGDAGLLRRLDAAQALILVQRERLFGQHMLAGRRRGDDLVDVLRMRCHQHDGVDLGIGQYLGEAVGQRQAVLLAETAHLVGGNIDGAGELQLARIGRGANVVLAPPAKSDDGSADHVLSPCLARAFPRCPLPVFHRHGATASRAMTGDYILTATYSPTVTGAAMSPLRREPRCH